MAASMRTTCIVVLTSLVSANGARPPTVSAQTPTNDGQATQSCDSLNMQLIAQTEGQREHTIAFGDTDHDGLNEIVIWIRPNNYRIIEHQGGNQYMVGYTGGALHPYAVGDPDQDGKSDLVGQVGSQVFVYESQDHHSYPTALVWSSMPIGNVAGHTALGDTDRDGHMELIHTPRGALYIYENTGDNDYTLKYSAAAFNANSEKVIADLDGDMLTDIAYGGIPGEVVVFEATADDVWGLKWVDHTDLSNADGVEGGMDTDGNGLPELFVTGNRLGDPTEPMVTYVYEAIGDDTYAAVDTLVTGLVSCCVSNSALGDLDGRVPPELMVMKDDPGSAVYFYRPTSIGQWTHIGTLQDAGYVNVYDLNGNGRMELVVGTLQSIRIYEHIPTATDTVLPATTRGRILAYPNPVRTEATLVLPDHPEGLVWLSVFDVRGRLLRRTLLGDRALDRVPWTPEGLVVGVYLLQIEGSAGQVLATGRLLVAR